VFKNKIKSIIKLGIKQDSTISCLEITNFIEYNNAKERTIVKLELK